jgi:hypothetical protein
MSANQPSKFDMPEEYERLTSEERGILLDWIDQKITPAKSVYKWATSYGLKHQFEVSSEGFYITNGQFKGAMLAAGYQPSSPYKNNWHFRIRLRKR